MRLVARRGNGWRTSANIICSDYLTARETFLAGGFICCPSRQALHVITRIGRCFLSRRAWCVTLIPVGCVFWKMRG